MVLNIVPALHSYDKTEYYHKLFKDKCSVFTFVYGAKPKTFDLVCENLLSNDITYFKILKVQEATTDKITELERSMRKNIMSASTTRRIYEIHIITNNIELKDKLTFIL